MSAGLVLTAAPMAGALPAGPAHLVDGDEQLETETQLGASETPAQQEQPFVVDVETVDLPLGSSFSVVPGATSTITFAVPQGLTPVAFRASLSGIRTGIVQISSTDRALGAFDASSTEVLVPVSAQDVTEVGTVVLTFSFTGDLGTWCAVDGASQGSAESALVSEGALALTGDAELPESVAAFFGAGVRQATIEVPAGAEADLSAAALNLVAAASAALGADADVRLHVDGSMEQPAAADRPAALSVRRVVLVPASGEVSTAIDFDDEGIARLTLSGGSDELLAASLAFAHQGIALASTAETQGLAGTLTAIDPTAAETTLTLADLGIGSVSLEGYGRQDAYFGISQGSFARSLEGLKIQLRGAISATEATVATVQLLWNGTLIDAFPVDPSESQLDRTIEIPAAALRSGNGLVVRLQAVTASNECIDERLLPQVRLDVDSKTSTVTAASGVSAVADFQDFPQSFSGTARLAFGTGVTAAQLSAAGDLVAALQRATPLPLMIDQVSPDELVGGSASGILIGATSAQAQALRTPLRFSDVRLISDGAGQLTVSVDQPYGALQAVRDGSRSLLVLGAYLAGDDTDGEGVLAAAVGGLDGTSWWQLDGAVRLATPGGEPTLIDVNEIVPQEEAKADYVPVAVWGIAALVVLISAGLLAAGIRARRRRLARRTVATELAVEAAQAEFAAHLEATEQAEPTARVPRFGGAGESAEHAANERDVLEGDEAGPEAR